MRDAETRHRASVARVVAALFDRHGRTYCEELGIPIATNTPSALFCWLCASLLFSARISAGLALRAARALIEHGWTTPRRMAEAGWSQCAAVLNRAGYARYDERTATMLGDTAELLRITKGSSPRREADRDYRHSPLSSGSSGCSRRDIFNCRKMSAFSAVSCSVSISMS